MSNRVGPLAGMLTGAARYALAALGGLGACQALAGPSAIELEIMQNAEIGLAEAVALAERELDGGRVIEAELDEDDDMYFYKLEVMGGDGLWLVYVNPASGMVVGRRAPGLVTGAVRDEGRQKAEAVAAAGTSMVQALGIAERSTGGKAIDIELQRDNGTYFYEVETIQPNLEHKLEIDSGSGGRILDFDEDD